VFEARVITLCDRDIATNFGVVAGEVILVDSCAIIFICCDCYFFFWKKKKRNKIFACCDTIHYDSGTVQNRFFGGIRYPPFVS
jgi:hypothetical protein